MMKIDSSPSDTTEENNPYRGPRSLELSDEDDDEDVYVKRNIKTSYVTKIYNYFTGKKTPEDQQEIPEDRQSALGGQHSSSYNRFLQSSTRNKYMLNNGNGHYGGHRQNINKWAKYFWLLVLLVGVPLVLILNYYYPLGAGASYLLNMLPSFKLGSIWPEGLSSGGGGQFARPYTSEIDAFKLREELSELRDIINAQQIQLQKQYRQQHTDAIVNVQPEVDELKEKLRELELRMISCCQKKVNSSAEIEEEVRQLLQGKWLKEIRQNYDHQLQTEVAKVQQHLVNYFQEYAKQQKTSSSIGSDGESIDTSNIERLIKQALAKYDADKTGEADYALESTGNEFFRLFKLKTNPFY